MTVAVDLFWDAENSTNGTAMTTTILGNGTHTSATGSWTVTAAGANTMKVSTSGQKGNGTREFSVSGTPYTDSSGTRGMQHDHSLQTAGYYYSWVKTVATAKWSASIWFNPGMTYQDFESYTLFGLQDSGSAGGAFFNLQTFGASSHETYLENADGSTIQGPSISRLTWYLICLLYDQANNLGKLAIFDTSYAQVGSTVQLALGSSPGNCSEVRMGSFGGNFPTHAVSSYYDDLAVDMSGTTFPLIPTAAATAAAKQLMMLGVG